MPSSPNRRSESAISSALPLMAPDGASSNATAIAADRSAVIKSLLKVFAEEGVQFAYPTQTTFTAAPDGALVMPYAPPAQPGKG